MEFTCGVVLLYLLLENVWEMSLEGMSFGIENIGLSKIFKIECRVWVLGQKDIRNLIKKIVRWSTYLCGKSRVRKTDSEVLTSETKKSVNCIPNSPQAFSTNIHQPTHIM